MRTKNRRLQSTGSFSIRVIQEVEDGLLVTLAAAMRGAKATTELLQAALAIKVDNATLTKINDALNQVRIIQDALFEAQQELFKLQQENYELRQEQNARNE